MFNRVKQFLDSRPDPATGSESTSAYRFWKDTELSRTTAYRLYNDPSYIPTGDVLDKICSTYRIKPGLILDWEPDDGSLSGATETKSREGAKTEDPPGAPPSPASSNPPPISIFREIPHSA